MEPQPSNDKKTLAEASVAGFSGIWSSLAIVSHEIIVVLPAFLPLSGPRQMCGKN
jgi:hypothetical protein